MLVILDDDRLWSVGVGTESARPLELPAIHLGVTDDEPQTAADIEVSEANLSASHGNSGAYEA